MEQAKKPCIGLGNPSISAFHAQASLQDSAEATHSCTGHLLPLLRTVVDTATQNVRQCPGVHAKQVSAGPAEPGVVPQREQHAVAGWPARFRLTKVCRNSKRSGVHGLGATTFSCLRVCAASAPGSDALADHEALGTGEAEASCLA